MDAVTDEKTSDVVIEASAQVGKSEILLNIIGYFVEHEPAPILMIQPTLEMAEAFSKERLSPMIRDTAVLKVRFGDPRGRDSGNTLLHKQFPGGHIALAGSNSPASLASRPIRILIADEVDKYPASAGAEGDPLALGEKRTQTFWNRKKIKVSTPSIKGLSRIDAAYLESDRRRYFVPCQHCGQFQVLSWKQVDWTGKDPSQAAYVCVHCGVIWSESDRIRAVRAGKWVASAPFRGIAGFHISELYSPWSSLGEMAVEFIDAKAFPERLKKWVNTTLGEVWEESRDAMEPSALRKRAENYPLGLAPAGALLITAGVDVQGDRLEAYTWGYGRGEEAWVIDFQVFPGDPARPTVWLQLLEHLSRPIEHELGALVVPRTVAIDSGGLHTHEVYSFCRHYGTRRTEHGGQQIIAVKGQREFSKPIIGRPTPQDIDLRGEKIKKGVQLWPVGSSSAKQLIYGRLGIDTPGPGYIHTSSSLPEDFWDQLVSERLITKYTKGYPTLEWLLPNGRRNEALDCAVYAYAAACQLSLQRIPDHEWQKREETMKRAAPRAPEDANSPSPVSATPDVPAQPKTEGPMFEGAPPEQTIRRPHPFARPPGANWITGWRR